MILHPSYAFPGKLLSDASTDRRKPGVRNLHAAVQGIPCSSTSPVSARYKDISPVTSHHSQSDKSTGTTDRYNPQTKPFPPSPRNNRAQSSRINSAKCTSSQEAIPESGSIEMVKILYSHHAKVFISGRDPARGRRRVVDEIENMYPEAKGALDFMFLDLSDLASVEKSIE